MIEIKQQSASRQTCDLKANLFTISFSEKVNKNTREIARRRQNVYHRLTIRNFRYFLRNNNNKNCATAYKINRLWNFPSGERCVTIIKKSSLIANLKGLTWMHKKCLLLRSSGSQYAAIIKHFRLLNCM